MLDLGIVVQFLTDELIELAPILGGGKALEFIGQRQQLHLGKGSGPDHHFHQRKQFLVCQKLVHIQAVAFDLMGILKLSITH